MSNLIARFALYLASTLLMLIPASWAARYGVSFDGTTLHADLTVALSVGIFAGVAGAGLSAVVFAIHGSGGLAGFGRTLLYALSPALAALAAGLTGWGVSYADGLLSLHLPTLITAVFAGGSLSAGILARWGVR